MDGPCIIPCRNLAYYWVTRKSHFRQSYLNIYLANIVVSSYDDN